MSVRHKILRDIYEAPIKLASKVNFVQYMTNKREPAIDMVNGDLAKLSENSQVIHDTYPRKKLFRKLAFNLRIGKQK